MNIKKILHILAKVLFSLLLVIPIVGILGVLPPATRDLYNTDIAFEFITLLIQTGYINYIMVVVHALALIALWTHREALAALLMAPIVVNIVGFHLFLDGGLFTAGAIMANMLLILNVYFLWKNREQYKNLLMKKQEG